MRNIIKFEFNMMKNYLLFFFLLMLIACQSEEDTQIVNNNNGLSANSALTNNLKRLTQNPTAFDNFIDNSSKIRVDFPFEVTVNTTTNVSLQNTADYQNLINVLEATPIEDEIELNFPASVSTVNYNSQTINSESELSQFLQNLNASEEVNCVELVYPISLQFFDLSNTFIDTQTINNRAQLFNFLEDLSQNGFFYQFEYPIEADIEGTTQFINSNAEFNITFNGLSSSCFEPLLFNNVADDDPGDGDPDDLNTFIDFITSGDFIVSSLLNDGITNTSFDGDVFRFNLDNTISVDDGGSGIFQQVGQWTATVDDGDGVIEFDLVFDNPDFDDLDEDWDVVSFNTLTLALINNSSDGETNELVLVKL
ncbi:hypothetical protein [Flavobacteriaceae bacterium 14752]|uniref:hypothetical protein n=1 Tax=Mesohalobacter salilacus TaxID=2491711 RepID=UPI000F9F8307|nr:hypothetical protein EIG84_08750 [Flavobacteriaceae bacterium 14752]